MEINELEHLLLGPEDAGNQPQVTSRKTAGTNVRFSSFVLLDTPLGKGGVEALRWLMQRVLPNAADHLRTCTGTSGATSAQQENDAKGPENTRGAASATRRRATLPAQWSKRPDPSQETPREGDGNGS